MQVLYGNSLRWESLPRSPKFTTGNIFDDHSISLPWFTYPAIAQLLRIGLQGEKVLEYGSGSSTSFFLEQGCRVHSIEDNQGWAEYVKAKIGQNLSFHIQLKPESLDYVQSAEQLAAINPGIVLIDGKKRKECASEVVRYLDNNKMSQSLWMVILDNSDWHGSSYLKLASCEDFIGFDYYGYGPYNSYTWCTTLFLRQNSVQLRRRIEHSGPAKPMRNGLIEYWSEHE
jgi:hypothetical protein